MLDGGIRRGNRRKLGGDIYVPGGSPTGRVERRLGDRHGVERKKLGLVAVGARQTLGLRGGESDTGQRGENYH